MNAHSKAQIGTSGWHYGHWKDSFYPPDLSSDEFLGYYAQHFHTVEVNNSFYRLPSPETLESWRDAVPGDFTFAVKASRYITHMKKLKDPQDTLPNLLDRIKVLEDRLGPILFQLPPNWHCNLERLDHFLDSLPSDYRYAFEFRDPSWSNPQVYETLAKYEAAFCMYDFDNRLSPKEVTTDFVYVRLHGPDNPYHGDYDTQTLSGWAGAFSAWSRQNKQIFCYFDNDQRAYAIQNALELQKMID